MRFLRFDRLDLRGVASETFFSANQNWRRLSLNCVDLDWWEPGDGSAFIHRMVHEMTPQWFLCNSWADQVPYQNFEHNLWYAFEGVPPPPAHTEA